MTDKDLKAIQDAFNLIKSGSCKRVDLGLGIVIYKVPSNNPSKYIIRLDAKIQEDEDGSK